MKPWENGELRVSENHRYLKNGNTPFFWLGDTAWLLFARLRPEEARVYLKNRKEKGYTVIQATLIHEWPQKNVDGADAVSYTHLDVYKRQRTCTPGCGRENAGNRRMAERKRRVHLWNQRRHL